MEEKSLIKQREHCLAQHEKDVERLTDENDGKNPPLPLTSTEVGPIDPFFCVCPLTSYLQASKLGVLVGETSGTGPSLQGGSQGPRSDVRGSPSSPRAT